MSGFAGYPQRGSLRAGRPPTVRALVLGTTSLALLALPSAAGAATGSVHTRHKLAELGGYTLTAQATPVAIWIYEPTIPIPAEPQLELDLSYTRATFSTGPTGRAVSSLLWPGDGVGYGLPQLLNNPDLTYPIKVDAAHPSGPADAKQDLVPGTGMTAHAGQSSITASASIAKPALPALPATGVPLPPMLVAVEAFASQSTTSVTADNATATAYATAGSVSLLGGLVRIDGLRVDTTAASDGVKGTTTGKVTWASLTLAGQTFVVDDNAVTAPGSTTPLPKLPADVSKRLADFGLRIDVPKVEQKAEETGASVTGQGLTITLDTAVMKAKLDLGWLLDPFLALLPSELRTQLSPWLAIAPKLALVLGTASSQATATPAYVGEAPPPDTGPADGSQGGGFTSGDGGSTGGDLTPTAAEETGTPVASGRAYPVFPGVPWYLFVLGLGLAAAVSYGLRRWLVTAFGAGACDRGATSAIPNLRQG